MTLAHCGVCEAARLEKVGTSGMWEDLRDRWGQSEVPESRDGARSTSEEHCYSNAETAPGCSAVVWKLGEYWLQVFLDQTLSHRGTSVRYSAQSRDAKGLTVVWTLEIVKS